ncbi:hypothetical protein ACRALDRAFT_1072666 [Sodiomyces alcalophilus JCM 7366]|uniref:uncharacterized protein n=1 Tax=Sodiomyces alcalophilus JCM 7366 TaxID=591952 RepID=UPI0039B44C02
MDASMIQYLPHDFPPEFIHQLPNGSYVHIGMFNVFGPDANCTLDLCPIEWSVYQYRPMLGVNIMFIVLYALLLAVHAYLGWRWRSWWFAGFMASGCLFEILGYAGRVQLFYNPWNFSAFLTQAVCITSAPVFFTASIYVTLSKAIEFFSPQSSRMPARLFYWFILADIICLALQGSGGALSTLTSGVSQEGIDLSMAGLVLQVIVLVVFCGLFIDFMVRYLRRVRRLRPDVPMRDVVGPTQELFFGMLSVAFLFILGRCIYRVDELSEGYLGSARITNERLYISLEGLFIVFAVIALCIGHPGFGFRESEKAKLRSAHVQLNLVEDDGMELEFSPARDQDAAQRV